MKRRIKRRNKSCSGKEVEILCFAAMSYLFVDLNARKRTHAGYVGARELLRRFRKGGAGLCCCEKGSAGLAELDSGTLIIQYNASFQL